MTCPQCGAPVAQGLRFCKQCWSPVEATSAPAPEVSPSPAATDVRGQHGPLFGVGYNEPMEPASGPLRSVNLPRAPLVAQPWTPPSPGPAEGKPSARAVASMLFGILSVVFFCGFPFTVPLDLIGIALAFFELRAIGRGEKPIAGRNLSVVGLTICSIVLAIKAFFLLVVFR